MWVFLRVSGVQKDKKAKETKVLRIMKGGKDFKVVKVFNVHK